ncbi:MAG: hypothetical protein ABIK44_06995 [candidate division WOR-3 bacterium]
MKVKVCQWSRSRPHRSEPKGVAIDRCGLSLATLLAELCRDNGHTRLHGVSQQTCRAWLQKVTQPVLNNGHMRNGHRPVYDEVLEEWARLFTSLDGPGLISGLTRNLTVWSALYPSITPMLEECLSRILHRLRLDKEVEYETRQLIMAD